MGGPQSQSPYINGKDKSKGIVLPVFFNSAPCHEGVLGSVDIAPCIL
jgi:hypothetical protein